jgi:hypothetical protein
MLAVERKEFYIWFEYQFFEGCAMARAVSRLPLTAESRVRARVNPCEICGGQSGTGTGFSSNFSVFLLSLYLHRRSPYSYHLRNEEYV